MGQSLSNGDSWQLATIRLTNQGNNNYQHYSSRRHRRSYGISRWFSAYYSSTQAKLVHWSTDQIHGAFLAPEKYFVSVIPVARGLATGTPLAVGIAEFALDEMILSHEVRVSLIIFGFGQRLRTRSQCGTPGRISGA